MVFFLNSCSLLPMSSRLARLFRRLSRIWFRRARSRMFFPSRVFFMLLFLWFFLFFLFLHFFLLLSFLLRSTWWLRTFSLLWNHLWNWRRSYIDWWRHLIKNSQLVDISISINLLVLYLKFFIMTEANCETIKLLGLFSKLDLTSCLSSFF